MGLSTTTANGPGLPGLAALQSMPGLASGGVVDMSILFTISPPDAEQDRKYKAMGLPDPVAFAALTALGAVRDPAAMLDAMLLRARECVEKDAPATERLGDRTDAGSGMGCSQSSRPPPIFLPPGKSFVEAFQEMHQGSASVQAEEAFFRVQREKESARYEAERLEQRLKTQVKEVAAQAKVAAAGSLPQPALSLPHREQLGEVAAAASRARDVAQFFSTGADDEEWQRPPPARPSLPLPTTLSGLLSGVQPPLEKPGAFVPQAGLPDKICISGLPSDASTSTIRLECARHGAVTTVIVPASGGTAYVSFAAAEMAAHAARRLVGRSAALGCGDPLEVRLISELPLHARLAGPPDVLSGEIVDPMDLPAHLRPRDDRKRQRRSRSRRRSRSQSRHVRSQSRKRGRSKDRKKKVKRVSWLDRSRSNSHTATGQYIRATGCSSTVKFWEKRRPSSGSSGGSSRSRGRPRRGARLEARRREADEAASQRPRQVAVSGMWAQFMQGGSSYYHHIAYGFTTWDRPSDFERGALKGQPEGLSRTSVLL